MQTPKAKTGSSEVPQRKSPITPRTARQLKTPGSDSESVSSSPHPSIRTPKDRSPKVTDHKSPRSPASERKRPIKVSELETQLAQLQDELKKTKEQLNKSESLKKQAEQDAEEVKKQLLAMSEKVEESQRQLLELSASEEERVQELRKISQERDKAWQSELEAVQKQHAMDSAALASAMNEIQKLKSQMEMVAESEATQIKHADSSDAEIQDLRIELAEAISLAEKLKAEISDCQNSEAEALEAGKRTQLQLEAANAMVEMLREDGAKAKDSYNSISSELEQSKAQVKSLEGLLSKLQADLDEKNGKSVEERSINVNYGNQNEGNEEVNQLKAELTAMRVEMGQLKSALDAAEMRYQEDYIQSTLQIRNAYEQVECTKQESQQKELELEEELKKAKAYVEQLRANLMDKETQLQRISEENKGLNLKIGNTISTEREPELATELKKWEADVAELKVRLLDKETLLQGTTEENKALKMEIEKRELERNKLNDEAVALTEAAKAAEQEALMKLGYVTEEADKSSRKVARVTEQLNAAQATNSEMEAELRRLKVQADQWRKAAEAAAAMLSTGNNGKSVQRTGSLDSNYPHGSPYSEDLEDDSPKKKNGNVLKKIGVLWRKGQK